MRARRQRGTLGAVMALGLFTVGCGECAWPSSLFHRDQCETKPIAPVTECLPEGGAPASKCTGADTEPNDSLPFARDTQMSGCSYDLLHGTLAGKADADYFRGRTSLCKDASPSVVTDTPDVNACLLVQCHTGSTSITACGGGAYVRHHPSGLLGCCATEAGKDVGFSVDCGGDDKSVDVYLLVDGGPDACTDYSVRFRL